MFVSIMTSCSIKQYYLSQTTLDARIAAIEALIEAMLVNGIDAVDNSGTASYSMDDGQMKVTTQYRSLDQIQKGIWWLERVKNYYVSKLDGSVTVLRGALNHKYGNNC